MREDCAGRRVRGEESEELEESSEPEGEEEGVVEC